MADAEWHRQHRARRAAKLARYEAALIESRAIASTATGPKGQRIIAVVDAALGEMK